MPYEAVKDLPEEVKSKYKGRKLRQFMHIVNSELDSGKSESDSFATAHSVAGGSKSLGWDDIYEVMDRQVTQANSGYNPIGGTDSKACANCNWFVVKRDACILVSGDIVATGLSDYWEPQAEYVFEPIHVIVDNKEIKDPILSKVKSMWETFTKLFMTNKENPQLSGIYFVSKEGESTRFFIWASNNYKDKHGEIISEAAHKEFVQWCDDNNTYPELWLWHAVGTKSGQVDWMDYMNGFLVTSGLIDPEAEAQIKSLEGQDIRASHAFLGRWKGALCAQYRSWEVSILPGDSVANAWTSYLSLKEEAKMPFNEKKREWLMKTAGVDEGQIKQWEDATTQMRDHLTSLGIEFKSDESDELPSGNDANIQDEMLKSMLKAQQDNAVIIAGLAEQVAILKKGDDEKLVEMIKSEVSKLPAGFRPASSKETETDTPADTDEDKEAKNAWFKDMADVLGTRKS